MLRATTLEAWQLTEQYSWECGSISAAFSSNALGATIATLGAILALGAMDVIIATSVANWLLCLDFATLDRQLL